MVIHSLEAFWRFLKRGYMSYCSPPSMSITCVLWRGTGGKKHVPRLNISLMDVSDRSLSDRWKIYQTRLNLKVQVQNLAWEAGYTVRNTISNFSCSCTLCLIIHHYKRQDSRQDGLSVGTFHSFSASSLGYGETSINLVRVWQNLFFLSFWWRKSLLRLEKTASMVCCPSNILAPSIWSMDLVTILLQHCDSKNRAKEHRKSKI